MTHKPAVELEEITPIVMAEGSTLTTKEVMLPEKGILKGDDERKMTDKKRDRRLKKYKQGMKAKHEEEKGILKGDDERTMTDKKRDRRLKKYKQGMKAKHEEEKDEKKTKKATKSGRKLDSDTS